MYGAGVALLVLVGAWVAWRSHPLYSARATLRFVGGVLAAIAVLVLLIVGAVRLTGGRSLAVQMTVMAGVVLAGTLAMIFVTVRLSESSETRPPSLPAGAVRPPRVRTRRWAGWLGLGLAGMVGLAGVGWLAGWLAVEVMALTLAGLGALLGVVLVATMYWAEGRALAAELAVRATPWVWWSYSAEEWAAWVEVLVERSRTAPREMSRAGAERLRRKLLGAKPEAIFGRDGLVADGVWTPWMSSGVYLVLAKVDERPPRSLVLCFARQTGGALGVAATVRVEHAVPVPAGAEADLVRLAGELRERCPKASVELG
jgi:hypothetical protein